MGGDATQNNARVGGVLSIISGAFGVLWLIGAVFSMIFIAFMINDSFWYNGDYQYGPSSPDSFFTVMMVFYGIMGGIATLLGVLAIVGGAFALKRKYWGLTLAGAIGATLVFFPCGIPAIIFIAIAKPEFEGQSPPA